MREAQGMRDLGVLVKKGLAAGHLDPQAAIEFVLSESSVDSLVLGGLNLDPLRIELPASPRKFEPLRVVFLISPSRRVSYRCCRQNDSFSNAHAFQQREMEVAHSGVSFFKSASRRPGLRVPPPRPARMMGKSCGS